MDSQNRYSFWKKILFVVYGILCVLLFVYMKFPYYALKPKFENALSKVSNMDISVSTIKPALPVGWTLGGLKVRNEHMLDSLTVKPRILPLFLGDIAMSVRMTEGKGYLKGSFGTSFFKVGRDVDVSMSMKNLELSFVRNFSKSLEEISGVVSGDIDFSYDRGHPEKSDGEADLVIENGQIPLNIQSFPIAAIPFSKFELNAKMDRGLLKISKADLTGNDVSGNLRGDMKIGDGMNSTSMNFIAGLKLSQSYRALLGPVGNDNVKIIISGTLESPMTSIQ